MERCSTVGTDAQLKVKEGKWNKPRRGTCTCNVDTAVFKEKGLSSIAAIIRVDSGAFIAAMGECFVGVFEPKEAEAIGVREALSWLKEGNMLQVTIETDAQVVVQPLSSNSKDLSYFGSLIDDCTELLTDMLSYKVCFVGRSANLAARKIAREASSRPGRYEWLVVPSFLIDVLKFDLK
ncbi:hypothetical protein Syun_027785 [Stephania yunnanensis]|uniref:RNase H type-1 domain-containing protein n=1 Tax=Stephania yunnanensis TaxID=152371 RepID=A0AAP0EQ38_9MAGN